MSKTKIIAEPGKQEILITRTFNVPREILFKVYTDPLGIPKWWGPEYLTTSVEKMELHPGGLWRFVQRDKDGNIFGFHGYFHELVEPERIIQTFEFDGMPGHVSLETLRFEANGNQTNWIGQSVFQSVADRDGMMHSGMEAGVVDMFNRLDTLLATLV